MFQPIIPVSILAVGIHPDDIELGCSGTLLRHIAQGHTVGLLDLSRGELGSRGSAQLRTEEATQAAQLLGATFRVNADLADGFFTWEEEALRRIISVVRAARPTVVLCNSLSDRHPDHGRAAKLVADACFYSGLIKIVTYTADGETQEVWRPRAIYHYIQDHNLTPDFVVDISPHIERKMEVVQAFRSQFYVPSDEEYSQEPSTPISGKGFMDFLRMKAATYGRIANYDYAEGFNVARTPGVTDLLLLD